MFSLQTSQLGVACYVDPRDELNSLLKELQFETLTKSIGFSRQEFSDILNFKYLTKFAQFNMVDLSEACDSCMWFRALAQFTMVPVTIQRTSSSCIMLVYFHCFRPYANSWLYSVQILPLKSVLAETPPTHTAVALRNPLHALRR